MHDAIRRIAILVKTDDGFSSALLELVDDAARRNRPVMERLNEVDQRSRRSEERIRLLERRLRGVALKRLPRESARSIAREARKTQQGPIVSRPDTGTPREVSRTRKLALDLLKVRKRGSDGRLRVLRRAEMEKEIMRRLRVSRNVALSATSWAVRTHDPRNPHRRTHRPPVARKVDDGLRKKMRQLAANGLTQAQIAQRVRANVRTVRRHLYR
jgi:hypothetical protein